MCIQYVQEYNCIYCTQVYMVSSNKFVECGLDYPSLKIHYHRDMLVQHCLGTRRKREVIHRVCGRCMLKYKLDSDPSPIQRPASSKHKHIIEDIIR